MAPTFPVFFLKVRFLYLPDNEMAERKKWELSEAVKEDSEVLTLQGYRQMVALAGLRDFLRSIRKDCSPEAMETWPLGGTYFVSSILCPGDRFVSRETTEKLRLGPRVKSLKSRSRPCYECTNAFRPNRRPRCASASWMIASAASVSSRL